MKLTREQIVNADDEFCPHCKTYNVKMQYSYDDLINKDGKEYCIVYDYKCSSCGAKFKVADKQTYEKEKEN